MNKQETTNDPLILALTSLISSTTSEDVKKLAKIVRELAEKAGHKPLNTSDIQPHRGDVD